MRGLTIAALMVSVLSLSLVGCKSDESDDIAKAQDCLDKVPQSNPAAADACMSYVAKYDSQQANILKCSILLTSGGLVASKVVMAFDALKSNGVTNPTSQFLGALALTIPDPAGGMNKAKRADVFCKKTGIETIQSISSLILIGSVFNDALGGAGAGPGGGFSEPPLQSEIDAAIANCTGVNAGTCDPVVVGIAASTIADTYCTNPSANAATCAQIQGAISDSGGNNTDLGNAVFCYLNGQTYDFNTDLCI